MFTLKKNTLNTLLKVQLVSIYFYSHVLFKESPRLTYMAVEQAAFVTCNSFRLLEVFNRHFKLKKEEACKKRKKQVDTDEESGIRVIEKKKRDRYKQGCMEKKKSTHTNTQKKKGNKNVSEQPDLCISIKKSVSTAAKTIIG